MGTHPIFESDFDCLTEPEMDIGGHCTFMTCNKLDFLPIKCRFCLSDFCEDHMTPERHSCANLPQSSSASAKSTAPIESLPPCPVNECTTSREPCSYVTCAANTFVFLTICPNH